MSRSLPLLLALCAPAALLAQPDVPWRSGLYLDGGWYWSERVPLRMVNPGDADIAAQAQHLTVGAGPGQLPLVGASVAALRVCDEGGQELLYNIVTATGGLRREGALEAGDQLAVVLDCPAEEQRTYYVYAGNERAQTVPDFLQSGLVNGGAEAGRDKPDGWREAEVDDRHTVHWVAEAPHSGKYCLQTVVQPGAGPTWVKHHQTGIPVIPGATYELKGWVRGENVVGNSGWFLHVNGDKPQLINQTLRSGDGTFDWKLVETTFEVPAEGTNATIGTLLHGTGTAWFDDISLRLVTGATAAQVAIGPQETLKLAQESAPDAWLDDGLTYDHRCPIHVLNFDPEPRTGVLISADLRRTLGHLGPAARNWTLRVARGDRALDGIRSGSDLIFPGDLPARTVARFDLYVAESPAPAATDGEIALVGTPANLVRNASFEQGADMPDGWTFSEQREGPTACRFRREKRDDGSCARLDVPADSAIAWPGWHQEIPVKPNSTYIYAASVKSEGLDGAARIHAHIHTAEGELVKSGAFVGAGPDVGSTQDWTRLQTVIRTPPDAASIELHLTMNCHGTLWHDDVLLAEIASATVDPIERAPRRGIEPRLHVWQADPLVKVFPETPPQRTPSEVVVHLARNEYEPAQLVLRSPGRVNSVEVTVPPPTGPGGAKLDEVAINLVGYVPVDHPSSYYSSELPAYYRLVPQGRGGCDGWAGEWPDPLPPYKPFTLEPNRAQPIWLTIHAPADATPGEYRSNAQIALDGQRPISVPLRIIVWNFTLPDESHCKAIYDLRNGPGENILAPFDDPTDGYRAWFELLASRRVSPGLLPPPRFSYENGQVSIDFTEWDKLATICFDELKMNAMYTPWQLYSFGWAYKPRSIVGLEAGTPEHRAAWQSMYRQFIEHIKQKGWYDKFVYYISDEPHFTKEGITEQMIEACKMALEVDPKMPIYSSTWRHHPPWNGFITLWGVGQHGGFPVETMRERRAAGEDLWFTTDGQMCLDTPYLACERLLPYYCFKYDVSAYEFWGVSWWTYDPWERGWHSYNRQSSEGIDYRWVRYPNGDGFLTYPGRQVGQKEPVSTIRLEQAREGMEDYEYFVLLRDLIAKAPDGEAQTQAQAALDEAMSLVEIPNQGGRYSTAILPDPSLVPAARLKLGEAIEKLSG